MKTPTPDRSVEEIEAEINIILKDDVHRQCDYAVYSDLKELLTELKEAERQKRGEVVEAERELEKCRAIIVMQQFISEKGEDYPLGKYLDMQLALTQPNNPK